MINKRKLTLYVLFGLMLLLSQSVIGQVAVVRSTETTTIGGVEYYMHHVGQGETLYGISKAYQVSIEEIERLNPEIKDGLKAGDVIGIPVRTNQKDNDYEQKEAISETERIIASVEEKVGKEGNPVTDSILVLRDGKYTVKKNEDLYDIAKKFGIDLADFKAINVGLTNEPKEGTVIIVPNIENDDEYLLHKVEKNERTLSLLRHWKVSESDFRAINVSVGSHVFVNQVVLIPIAPVVYKVDNEPSAPDYEEPIIPDIVDEEDAQEEPAKPVVEEEPYVAPECNASPENALKTYKVALMVPLYLSDGSAPKGKKSRSLSFLQFYEGFMMASETLTKQHGLNLDLTVIDVTDNLTSAQEALEQIKKLDLDLIVGPFYGKSFDVIEEYAREKGIVIVNPLSNRESIVAGNPNVVKIKPSMNGEILEITALVKNRYHDANIFIVSREKDSDSLFLNQLENQLNRVVNEEVLISNEEFIQFAKDESERLEMGSKLVSTINVEGQVFSINEIQNSKLDGIVLHNAVKRYKSVGSVIPDLSGVRENLIIVYGEDNVFATQAINGLNKSADRFPITLVAIPDWTKFEKLLVSGLLKMNAIYFNDYFIDYNNDDIKKFVLRFRSKYGCEPKEYAFEGYDVAWYFLQALMSYGNDMLDCLPNFNVPLLHSRYYFMKKGKNDGIENQYWSVYQYDNEEIELKPIYPF